MDVGDNQTSTNSLANITGVKNDEHVGDVVRRIRKEKGLTQNALAQRINRSRSTVTNFEGGREQSDFLIADFVAQFPEHEDDIQSAQVVGRSGQLRQADTNSEAVAEGDELDAVIFRKIAVPKNITGEWHALWESTADQEEVINSEILSLKIVRGKRIELKNMQASSENPKGGYLWIADCRFFDNQYMLGTYVSVDDSVRSKGTLSMVLHRSGRYMDGQWTGCNYDSEFAHGIVVFSRSKEDLRDRYDRHQAEMNSIRSKMRYSRNEGDG